MNDWSTQSHACLQFIEIIECGCDRSIFRTGVKQIIVNDILSCDGQIADHCLISCEPICRSFKFIGTGSCDCIYASTGESTLANIKWCN